MALLGRPRVPAPLRGDLELAPREHVLAWASTPGGSHAVATSLGLHLPATAGGAGTADTAGGAGTGDTAGGAGRTDTAAPLRWDQIDSATWRPPELTVVDDDGHRRAVTVVEGDHLADVVRVHVEASIVVTRRRRAGPGAPALRVVVRRRSDTGAMLVHLDHEPGLDPDDPQVRAQGAALVAEVRADLGLPDEDEGSAAPLL